MVRVEEAKAEDTPCLGCPREDQDMRFTGWSGEASCPHLTLTLLARLARMLQGALLAQMGRCPRFF